MRASLVFRKVHKWISIVSLLPLALIFATGVALSISSKVPLLQPPPPQSSGPGVTLNFDAILAAAQKIPEMKIQTWDDVAQIDIRPKLGVVRVRGKNYWEIQLDAHTGEVLNSAPRWKTFLIVLHDGSWFGQWAKFGVFFPSGIAALILTITGCVLIFVPLRKKRNKR